MWCKGKHKRAVKRMENSVLNTLKLEGCAMSKEELALRSRIPDDFIMPVINRLLKKNRIYSRRTRNKKGVYTGVKYCEK